MTAKNNKKNQKPAAKTAKELSQPANTKNLKNAGLPKVMGTSIVSPKTAPKTDFPVSDGPTPKAKVEPAATREQLVQVAKEMNKIIAKCNISVKSAITDEIIQAQILSHTFELTSTDFVNSDPEADLFTAAATETLKAIGVKIPGSVPAAKETEKKATATKTPKAVLTDEQKAAAAIEKAAKTAQAKADKAAAKKAAKPVTYTWTDATEASIRKICVVGATLKEITDAAVIIYKEHNADAENVPKNVFRYMVTSLVRFGVLSDTSGKYCLYVKTK